MIGTYAALAINENIAAKLEYDRMSNNHTKFLPKLMTFYFSLTKNLLSIRTIKKFMLDVLYNQYLVKSHFHCLTETELQGHDDLDQIKSIFNGQFKIEFNINEDKCKNIMIRYKDIYLL